MIINRISNYFDFMDSAYSKLYERHLEFEKNPCQKTQEDLLESLTDFRNKYSNYKVIVKNAYFRNWLIN